MRSFGYPFGPVNTEQIAMKIRRIVPVITCTSSETIDNREQPILLQLPWISGEPLQVSWQLDGQPIPAATGARLDLSALQLSRESHRITARVRDSGAGYVRDEDVLENEFQQTREFTLEWERMHFTTGLSDQVVKKGKSVRLTVQAKYATSYEWFVNGKRVKRNKSNVLKTKFRKSSVVTVIAHEGTDAVESSAIFALGGARVRS